MNFRKFSFKKDQVGWFLGSLILTILTGCSSHKDRANQGEVYVAVPPPGTVILMEDDYVYYPYYQVYYSQSRRQYAYREGNVWVARRGPQGVSVDRLRASPSVRMHFNDSPANHHAVVVREYPKNWAPPGPSPGPNSGHKENQTDGQRGKNKDQ